MKYVVRSFLLLTLVLAVGCGSSDVPDSDKRPIPDGWTRVQVREGYVSRGSTDGFTVDLPPGWQAGESWAGWSGPTGWITGVREGGRVRAPAVRFQMGSKPIFPLEYLLSNDRIIVTHPAIEGQEALLYLAKEFAIDLGPQVGIYYEHIPGAPEGVVAPSLLFDGDSGGFTDPNLLGQVLTSIRYQAIEELPELPEITLSTGNDWKRTPARTDYPTFTLLVPPGWEITASLGADSLVGEFTGDGIKITYDFGFYGGTPYDPAWAAQTADYAPHRIWEETIGDISFSFVKPLSLSPDSKGTTGMFAVLEKLPDSESRAVTMYGHGLTAEQQEMALAIFRTIEFE